MKKKEEIPEKKKSKKRKANDKTANNETLEKTISSSNTSPSVVTSTGMDTNFDSVRKCSFQSRIGCSSEEDL